jgi:hypothetical protein
MLHHTGILCAVGHFRKQHYSIESTVELTSNDDVRVHNSIEQNCYLVDDKRKNIGGASTKYIDDGYEIINWTMTKEHRWSTQSQTAALQ